MKTLVADAAESGGLLCFAAVNSLKSGVPQRRNRVWGFESSDTDFNGGFDVQDLSEVDEDLLNIFRTLIGVLAGHGSLDILDLT